jgi:endonuclease/exonuclease/phosphatase family metal-dependent hydrolase
VQARSFGVARGAKIDPKAPRFVVASYNIHRCVGGDSCRDPKRIAEVIREINPDVIALQEVDTWPGAGTESVQMEFLAHVAGLHAISGPTLERQEGLHYGNVLLTRLPILEVRKLDLTVYRREPRGALDVELDAGGRRLRVIATHLGLLPSERRYQVQRILELCEQGEEEVTVLLGDINEWMILGRPLRWLHARFGRGVSGRSYPARFPLLSLDRIWVKPTSALSRFRVHTTPLSRRASDHLPVTAEITMEPAALAMAAPPLMIEQ